MPTTADYLNDLVTQKQALVDTLNNYGVEASSSETLNTLVPKVDEVYSKGQTAGGGDNHYDTFWDNYQDNGSRTDYQYAFNGVGWTNETFKPKYDIVPVTETYGLFSRSCIQDDLVEICEEQGITLDFSKATKFECTFDSSKFTRIGVIDASNSNRFNQVFYNCTNLETIGLLKLTENITSYINAFIRCTALQNIEIEGVIGANISFANSTLLTHDSLMSIINGLKDYYTVVEKTYNYTGSVTPFIFNGVETEIQYSIEKITENAIYIYLADGSSVEVSVDGDFSNAEIEGAEKIVFHYDESLVDPEANGEVGFTSFTVTMATTSTETHTLTLGSTNLAKLTDEEIAIATEKGWTLA